METKDLATTRPTPAANYFNPQHWNVMKVMAETFHKSGALPAHINNAPKLMMILQTGVELGLKPMQAINSLYIVNGRIAMSAQAMLGKLLQSGVKLDWKTDSPTACEVEFSGLERPTYTGKFTIEEAQKAGLVKPGSPWQTYPAAMLRARAVSIGARVFCPDIISGSYTLDEVAEIKLDADGREIYEAPRDLSGDNKVPAAPQGNTPLPPREDPNLAIKRLIAAECTRLGVDIHDDQFKQRIFEKTGYHLDDPANYSIILDTLKDIPTPPPAEEKPENPTPPPTDTPPEAQNESESGGGEPETTETPEEILNAAEELPQPQPEQTESEPKAEKAEQTPEERRAEQLAARDAMSEADRASTRAIGLFQSLLEQREGVKKEDIEAQIGYLFLVKNIDIDRLDQLKNAELSKINQDLLAKPARKE
jgi:hypothetical protein